MSLTIRTWGRGMVRHPYLPGRCWPSMQAEKATAVVVFERDHAGTVEVVAIERLPAGLDPAVAWLTDVQPGHVIIDADELGQALWDRLDPQRRRGWKLYDKRGRDRQELVNALLVATSEKRIRIGASHHGDAMRKALLGYRRVVQDDGLIGGELVIALALAAAIRRPPKPRVW